MEEGQSKLRILVGDDHPVYRDGIVRLFGPIANVIAQVANGRDALGVIRTQKPDVAVLDYRMPHLDGAQVASVVHREELPTRVVILSAFDDSAMVYRAMQDGVAGYLTKDSSAQRIVDTVFACARGETVLPEDLTSGLVQEIRQRADQTMPALTEREREVLSMIANGNSVPQISRAIFLAPTTIKSHVQRVYEKLGVSTRGAAVAEAMRRGLLE
ncbi:response regulator [Streptomyces sp. NPDC008121]|uniref:response regulator n=1 Tax=Streptomyces sp. NPDC008121 TaxID=3364809 RepID=UPI0036F09343